MIGDRRTLRTFVAIALAMSGSAIAGAGGQGQEQAAASSSSFRRAAERGKAFVVSIRIPDGMRPSVASFPPRVGRPGPGIGVMPGDGRTAIGEGPTTWSGVVIDAERGHILTTDRPTDGASALLVTFPDGSERTTVEVRRDSRSDLALLVVDPSGMRLQQASWGDPNHLQPGDWLIALGQPGVGPPTMSVGVFSARRRGIGEELIEIDATVPRLGAGGPLLNLNGELIGISKLVGRRGDGFDGMSHAIPGDRARRVAADLAQFGRVRRAYVGVQVDPVPPGSRDHPPGVRVSSVTANSPAAEAGLRPGDLILTVNGRPVDDVVALQQAVEFCPDGEGLKLTLRRDGRPMEFTVRPRVMPTPAGPARGARSNPLGPTPGDAIPGRPAVPGSPARPGTPDAVSPPDPMPPRRDGPANPPSAPPGTPPERSG